MLSWNTLRDPTGLPILLMLPDLGTFVLGFSFAYIYTYLTIRYMFHLSSYQRIAKAAPTWAEQFETGLLKLLLCVAIDFLFDLFY